MKLHFLARLLHLLKSQTLRQFGVLRFAKWCGPGLCIQYSKYMWQKTDELSFDCLPEQRIFLYSKESRLVPVLNQCRIQCALLKFSPDIQWIHREADESPFT